MITTHPHQRHLQTNFKFQQWMMNVFLKSPATKNVHQNVIAKQNDPRICKYPIKNFQKSKISVQGSIKKKDFQLMKKTKTKKSKEQHHQNKKLKKTSSVLDNNKNKQQIIPFRKKTKTKNLANKSVEKNTVFSDSRFWSST